MNAQDRRLQEMLAAKEAEAASIETSKRAKLKQGDDLISGFNDLAGCVKSLIKGGNDGDNDLVQVDAVRSTSSLENQFKNLKDLIFAYDEEMDATVVDGMRAQGLTAKSLISLFRVSSTSAEFEKHMVRAKAPPALLWGGEFWRFLIKCSE